MSYKYYILLLTNLLETLPIMEEIAKECCPTYYLDGTPCSPRDHLSNICYCTAEELCYEINLILAKECEKKEEQLSWEEWKKLEKIEIEVDNDYIPHF